MGFYIHGFGMAYIELKRVHWFHKNGNMGFYLPHADWHGFHIHGDILVFTPIHGWQHGVHLHRDMVFPPHTLYGDMGFFTPDTWGHGILPSPHRWGTWCSRRFYWKALDTTRTFTRTWNGLVSRRCFFAFTSVCALREGRGRQKDTRKLAEEIFQNPVDIRSQIASKFPNESSVFDIWSRRLCHTAQFPIRIVEFGDLWSLFEVLFVVVCSVAFVLLLFLLGLLWSALVCFGYWSCCLEVFLFRVRKEVWRRIRRRRTRRREEVEKEEAGKWFAARGGLLAWQKLRGLVEWLRYSTMEM